MKRPSPVEVRAAIVAAGKIGDESPRLLSLDTGIEGRRFPLAFVHDLLRSRLGEGEAVFAAARQAFICWTQFDLGWARVANPEIAIAAGQVVAVEVRTFGLWSLNLSCIVETVDTPAQFGFVYATTRHHAEQGEEIFRLELNPADGSVWYHLEAVSRPRHTLARLAYPLTRALQHRFARDSQRRMRSEVRVELAEPGSSKRQRRAISRP